MGYTTVIFAVGIMIFSLAFIFMAMLLIPTKVTKEKLEKIFGKETINRIKNAKDEDEIKAIIRSLPKRKKIKLKTLLESQDIRDVLKAINKHILK